MSGDIIREWHFWLASVFAGACMAFAYDVLRLFRRLVRHGRLAVDIEDIAYWSACFAASFALLYYENNGVIRFAAVVGAAVGMSAYAVTVGRLFIKVGFLLIDILKNFFVKKCRLTGRAFRNKIVLYFHRRSDKKNGGNNEGSGTRKRRKGGRRLWQGERRKKR